MTTPLKKTCFGRKTEFFRESGDFAWNRETLEIFVETLDNSDTLEEIGTSNTMSLKKSGGYSKYFRDDFHLHIVLLALLKLSPPVNLCMQCHLKSSSKRTLVMVAKRTRDFEGFFSLKRETSQSGAGNKCRLREIFVRVHCYYPIRT